jgi:putative phage-type endonuclease
MDRKRKDKPMERTKIVQPQTEAEWLAIRKGYAGSSETAAILGHSNWQSPWAVWAHKTGRMEDQFAPNDMAEWGHRLEPVIAEKFVEVTGRKILDPGDYHIETRGIFLATIDRDQFTKERPRRGVLELKSAYYDSFTQWETQVPIPYQIQYQQQLYATGCDWGSIAVLGNGCSWKYFDIERDEKFIARMVEVVSEWWDKHVVGDTPPPADGHKSTGRAIAAVYPEPKEETVDLVGEALQAAHERREALAVQIGELEEKRDESTNLIKAAIGDAQVGRLADGTGYTYKATKKARTLRRTKKNV